MEYVRFYVTLFAFIFVVQNGDRTFVASCDDSQSKDESTSSVVKRYSEEGYSNFDLKLSDLRPFSNQLAGHDYHLSDKKGRRITLGFMIDSDENVLKPNPTDKEISFFESLNTIQDSVVLEMKAFIPKYFGVKKILVEDDADGKVIKFLHIENIMKGYEMVCSMDVKIGLVRIPPGTPKRTPEQEQRYGEMMLEWGFGIPGFDYYKIDGTHEKQGKKFGYKMTLEQAVETIYGFVQGELGIKCGLVQTIIDQLTKIYRLYEKQQYFRFYDSSILLTYDAKNLVNHFKMYSDHDQAFAKLDCRHFTNGQIEVRMIDFGKAVFIKDLPAEHPDNAENYLKGIRNLILLLENIHFHKVTNTFKKNDKP